MRLRRMQLCRTVFFIFFVYLLTFARHFQWIRSSVVESIKANEDIDDTLFNEGQVAADNYNYDRYIFQQTDSAIQFEQVLFIFSSMRSGSSFVGQIFNQHPQAFYFFEPLFPLHDSCKVDLEKKVKILSGLASCNLTASLHYIDSSLKAALDENKEDNHSKRRIVNLQKCKESTICFRQSTKGLLCTKERCERDGICVGCSSLDSKQYIEQKCEQSKLRVIKTVRSCHLDLLGRVYEQSKSTLKVLHLVRDPRATALSRLKMHHGLGDIAKEMKINCLFDLTNLDAYRNRPKASWLNGRYMFVRYEDVVTNIHQFLKAATKFLNHGLSGDEAIDLSHNDVLTWLQQNTASSAGSMYSTSRNASEQASKWRRDAPMTVVSNIQGVCGKMMTSFGYIAVETDKELHDYSIDLFKPLPGF